MNFQIHNDGSFTKVEKLNRMCHREKMMRTAWDQCNRNMNNKQYKNKKMIEITFINSVIDLLGFTFSLSVAFLYTCP